MTRAAAASYLLMLTCSPCPERSVSRHMGRLLAAAWLEREPAMQLRQRDLVAQPPPPVHAEAVPGNELATELAQARGLLIASPVHNYTVPAPLKAWIDHILRPGVGFRHTPQGKAGLLEDRPTLVAVSAGGSIFEAGARQPDFFRPFLTAALRTIGITDIRFVSFESTAAHAEPLPRAAEVTRAWIDRHLTKAGS